MERANFISDVLFLTSKQYTMKLENITQDIILSNYAHNNCDKLVSKGVVYYAYDAPRYGETDIEKYRVYVEKMKLVIQTLRQ